MCLSIVVIELREKELEKERAYLPYWCSLPLREARAGTEAETMVECWLATSA